MIIYVLKRILHKKKSIFMQLLESLMPSLTAAALRIIVCKMTVPHFDNQEKDMKKAFLRHFTTRWNAFWVSKNFFLFFFLSSQYSPHSYCAPPPARARSGHWPPPHVSENWTIIQISNFYPDIICQNTISSKLLILRASSGIESKQSTCS